MGELSLCCAERCARIMHTVCIPLLFPVIYIHKNIFSHAREEVLGVNGTWLCMLTMNSCRSFHNSFLYVPCCSKMSFFLKEDGKMVLEVIFLQLLKYFRECHSMPEACSCSFKTKVYVACPWRWQESTGDSKSGGKWLNDSLGWRNLSWAQFCSSCLKQPIPGVKQSLNYAPVLSWMQVVGSLQKKVLEKINIIAARWSGRDVGLKTEYIYLRK